MAIAEYDPESNAGKKWGKVEKIADPLGIGKFLGITGKKKKKAPSFEDYAIDLDKYRYEPRQALMDLLASRGSSYGIGGGSDWQQKAANYQRMQQLPDPRAQMAALFAPQLQQRGQNRLMGTGRPAPGAGPRTAAVGGRWRR